VAQHANVQESLKEIRTAQHPVFEAAEWAAAGDFANRARLSAAHRRRTSDPNLDRVAAGRSRIDTKNLLTLRIPSPDRPENVDPADSSAANSS